ncbi:UNKNOWN [Stylonychia lemnae]|uniref:Uncharacterized protein n=1 Tax=Stylonychia lemnae TaxID=5949 RepID=A0A078APD8_STYLE|nr:UNKNOWN [Stylonychia lemnae]|eukprot:CDW83999.1 UNKNOWN [Stylonychia lemnae]
MSKYPPRSANNNQKSLTRTSLSNERKKSPVVAKIKEGSIHKLIDTTHIKNGSRQESQVMNIANVNNKIKGHQKNEDRHNKHNRNFSDNFLRFSEESYDIKTSQGMMSNDSYREQMVSVKILDLNIKLDSNVNPMQQVIQNQSAQYQHQPYYQMKEPIDGRVSDSEVVEDEINDDTQENAINMVVKQTLKQHHVLSNYNNEATITMDQVNQSKKKSNSSKSSISRVNSQSKHRRGIYNVNQRKEIPKNEYKLKTPKKRFGSSSPSKVNQKNLIKVVSPIKKSLNQPQQETIANSQVNHSQIQVKTSKYLNDNSNNQILQEDFTANLQNPQFQLSKHIQFVSDSPQYNDQNQRLSKSVNLSKRVNQSQSQKYLANVKPSTKNIVGDTENPESPFKQSLKKKNDLLLIQKTQREINQVLQHVQSNFANNDQDQQEQNINKINLIQFYDIFYYLGTFQFKHQISQMAQLRQIREQNFASNLWFYIVKQIDPDCENIQDALIDLLALRQILMMLYQIASKDVLIQTIQDNFQSEQFAMFEDDISNASLKNLIDEFESLNMNQVGRIIAFRLNKDKKLQDELQKRHQDQILEDLECRFSPIINKKSQILDQQRKQIFQQQSNELNEDQSEFNKNEEVVTMKRSKSMNQFSQGSKYQHKQHNFINQIQNQFQQQYPILSQRSRESLQNNSLINDKLISQSVFIQKNNKSRDSSALQKKQKSMSHISQHSNNRGIAHQLIKIPEPVLKSNYSRQSMLQQINLSKNNDRVTIQSQNGPSHRQSQLSSQRQSVNPMNNSNRPTIIIKQQKELDQSLFQPILSKKRSNDQLLQSNPSNEFMLKLTLTDDKEYQIKVMRDSDAALLAAEFCLEHNLPSEIQNEVEDLIKRSKAQEFIAQKV